MCAYVCVCVYRDPREETWQVLCTHLSALSTMATLRTSQDWDGWERLISALSAVSTFSVPHTCAVPVRPRIRADCSNGM